MVSGYSEEEMARERLGLMKDNTQRIQCHKKPVVPIERKQGVYLARGW